MATRLTHIKSSRRASSLLIPLSHERTPDKKEKLPACWSIFHLHGKGKTKSILTYQIVWNRRFLLRIRNELVPARVSLYVHPTTETCG